MIASARPLQTILTIGAPLAFAGSIFFSHPANAQIAQESPLPERGISTLKSPILDSADRRSILAHEVFEKTLAAADKRPGQQPTLYVLDDDGYPWARSIADGSILLTRGAIEICMKAKTIDKVKARLAFVLGHELSHQVNGDFWHYFFYEGVRSGAKSAPEHSKTLSEVAQIAKKSDSILTKELKADQYGALYASLAGYDVRTIIESGASFFDEWAMATSPALLEGRSPTHPERKQRVAAVRLALLRVAGKITVFEKGVVAYQNESYSVAKYHFEDFLSVYQSREAFNNLGLVYYQMASQAYGLFASEVDDYRLSLVIDKETRAKPPSSRRFSLQGSFDNSAHKIRYQQYAKMAIDFFIEAARRDHTYAPAHNNLACVYFLKEEYAAAVGEFDRALALEKTKAEFYNNRALAYIRLGEKLSVDLSDKAEADLLQAVKIDSGYIEALYNLAAFYRDRGMEDKKAQYAALLRKKAPGSPLLKMLD